MGRDEILERIDFIKGHIIADERSHALQQLKELHEKIFEDHMADLEELSEAIKKTY